MIEKLFLSLTAFAVASGVYAAEGYTDTPMIPGSKWHIHDPNRPVPPVVTPGQKFSDMAAAPSDAVVLFDGTDFSKWQSQSGGEVKWKIQDGYMESTKTGRIRT